MCADDDDAADLAVELVPAALDAEHVDDLDAARRARAGRAAMDLLDGDAAAAGAPDRGEAFRRPGARRADAALGIVRRGQRVARAEADQRRHVGPQPLGRGGERRRGGEEEEREHGPRWCPASAAGTSFDLVAGCP